MADALQVSVLTAEGQLFDGPADFVVAPGADGELGILPRHVPLVALLKPGALRVEHGGAAAAIASSEHREGDEEVLYVSGGFVEVGRNPDGSTVVTVLADSGERGRDIDEAQAEASRKRAQELLTQTLSREEYTEAVALLERSTAQIRVADVARRRRSRREAPMRG